MGARVAMISGGGPGLVNGPAVPREQSCPSPTQVGLRGPQAPSCGFTRPRPSGDNSQALGGRRHRLRISLLALSLCALLGGCATAAPSATTTSTPAAATATSAPAATLTPGGPPTPTITPLPGSGNLAGATDICTSAINVTTTLPAEIPPYTGQLRLAQTNNDNGSQDGVYGYCSGDSVDAITAFYVAQLPGKGWQGIQTFDNNATRNIIATRGSEQLTITVSPDVVQTGSADLLIIVKGQSA